MGVRTSEHISTLGHEFYANEPAELLKLDFANPTVRPHMHLYPEIASEVSEFWQARRLFDEPDLDLLQPMWADWERASHRHFYIKELAALQDGTLVIPMMWYTKGGEMYLDGHTVTRDPSNGKLKVVSNGITAIKASELKSNYLDLTQDDNGNSLEFDADSPSWAHQMPNPIRELADERPVFNVNLMVWSDDVSGNRSKQYNPHTNVYLANLSLPHRKLQQEYFVRFCSTSPHASSSEQMDAVSKNTGKESWHTTYDCQLGEEIMFRVIKKILPGDNPQQSKTCSHIGLKGNLFCRRCLVGGTNKDKESNEGYHALLQPSRARTREDTVEQVKRQLFAAGLGVQETISAMQTESGVKDKIAQHWIDLLVEVFPDVQQERIRNPATCDARLKDHAKDSTSYQTTVSEIKKEIQVELHQWLVQQPPHRFSLLPENSPLRHVPRGGDHYNILLDQPELDVHRDTPIEVLHTILLGHDKYIWHETTSPWDKKKDDIFAVRLESSSTDGLSIPAIRGNYLMQYKKSLIGKHFKMLQQLAVFHLDGLCSEVILDMWKATGQLTAMLWYHTIPDMGQYLADLEVLISNVLDIWAKLTPERLITKPKLHLLPHVLHDIPTHGPAILYSTEVFECWNAIFRFCSVLSNHQAPSRDIARTLADVERFKHQVSGGWWKEDSGPGKGSYVQAGEHVRNFMRNNPMLQQRLGWAAHSDLVPGTVKLLPKNKQYPMTWDAVFGPMNTAGTSSASRGAAAPPGPPYEQTAVPNCAQAAQSQWRRGKYVISASRDACSVHSWVFYRDEERINTTPNSPGPSTVTPRGPDAVCVGRITDILCADIGLPDAQSTVVAVRKFEVLAENDARLDMPVLVPDRSCSKIQIVRPTDILFVFNAQHDCRTSKCSASGKQPIREERHLTERYRNVIEHRELERYFINMHALHNADLLRKALPRQHWAPKPYLSDRIDTHKAIATGLRVSRGEKRAATAAKQAETRARKRVKISSTPATATDELSQAVTSSRAVSSPNAGVVQPTSFQFSNMDARDFV
ncbi:hypothetical protein K474DRAFT_1617769 [Panus rudis PR-1116 ss-1]|nr:hypothetical protein K474DRAFT_1617769 [Panus rudis PR-1116 ss-1]